MLLAKVMPTETPLHAAPTYATLATYWASMTDPQASQDHALIDALSRAFTITHFTAMLDAVPVPKNATKSTLINMFLEPHRRLWRFASHPKAIPIIALIQRSWRAKRAIKDCVNNTDPFTCEAIADIDPANLFYCHDSRGHRYVFNAIELDYYVRTVAPQNPYTREPFSATVLAQLADTMKTLPAKVIADPTTLWTTPANAYTYVFHYYDRSGLSLNIDMFTKLSMVQIVDIFDAFLSRRRLFRLNEMGYMSLERIYKVLELDDQNDQHRQIHFALAREMLHMIQHEDIHRRFFLARNVLTAVASVSKKIGRSIPSWVLISTSEYEDIRYI